jgi:hypothetical protein
MATAGSPAAYPLWYETHHTSLRDTLAAHLEDGARAV